MENLQPVGLGITVLLVTCGVVWRLSRVELALRSEIQAAKEKTYQVEIWARDEFVRKASFDVIVARVERSMDNLGQRIEGKLEAMSQRIEKITHERS